jgi:23S rRNA pseudouridine1911/1915/1917 synthase
MPNKMTSNLDEEIAPIVTSIPPALAGVRLDKVLAHLLPGCSRQRLQYWIKKGRVQVNGMQAHKRQPAPLEGTIVIVPEQHAAERACLAESIPLDIIYEDSALVVINKPAGLVVHPAAGNWSGTLSNGLLHRYGEAASALPRTGLVHRLDKDTSGLMVIARTLDAHTQLVQQLQARTVKRRYVAFVCGVPAALGTIDAPLGRDLRNRLRFAVVHDRPARYARTHYRTIATGYAANQPITAVQCELETGRTHQIRVHFAHIGYPLIGDPVYGKSVRQRRSGGITVPLADCFTRQALHACQLELEHPSTGARCVWQAPLPEDIRALARSAGLSDALAQFE